MRYNQINQAYSLSYDKSLSFSYQKVPKIACSYSKKGNLYGLEDYPLR